jgi:exopolysaccharide biosynthesis WecB/TagA/CpsF family protein
LASLPAPSPLSPSLEWPGERSAKISFIDMGFTALGKPAVLQAVRERAANAPFAYVVTPNVDHMVRLQRRRSDLWPIYRSAWMTLCDSRILALLARSMGLTLPVLPGSDLTQDMFEHIVGPDDRIAIIGGDAGAIRQLAKRYRFRNVHHYNPPMGFIKDPAEVAKAVRFVAETGARYTFLAVGSPQQEMLAYRIKQAGGATGLGFCVGASLDFLTGVQTRAPRFMRVLALEWLHRLASDPGRMWRRYLYDGPVIFQITREWKRGARP